MKKVELKTGFEPPCPIFQARVALSAGHRNPAQFMTIRFMVILHLTIKRKEWS